MPAKSLHSCHCSLLHLMWAGNIWYKLFRKEYGFTSKMKTHSSSCLSAMLVRNQFPLEVWLAHLCLQHPIFHRVLGGHLRVLLVWFSEVPNRNSCNWLLFNLGKSIFPRTSKMMFLIEVWIRRQTLPVEIYLGQSFQTEVALIAVEISFLWKLHQLQSK